MNKNYCIKCTATCMKFVEQQRNSVRSVRLRTPIRVRVRRGYALEVLVYI